MRKKITEQIQMNIMIKNAKEKEVILTTIISMETIALK